MLSKVVLLVYLELEVHLENVVLHHPEAPVVMTCGDQHVFVRGRKTDFVEDGVVE